MTIFQKYSGTKVANSARNSGPKCQTKLAAFSVLFFERKNTHLLCYGEEGGGVL